MRFKPLKIRITKTYFYACIGGGFHHFRIVGKYASHAISPEHPFTNPEFPNTKFFTRVTATPETAYTNVRTQIQPRSTFCSQCFFGLVLVRKFTQETPWLTGLWLLMVPSIHPSTLTARRGKHPHGNDTLPGVKGSVCPSVFACSSSAAAPVRANFHTGPSTAKRITTPFTGRNDPCTVHDRLEPTKAIENKKPNKNNTSNPVR